MTQPRPGAKPLASNVRESDGRFVSGIAYHNEFAYSEEERHAIQDDFLKHYAEIFNARKAAILAGTTYPTLWEWRRVDKDFSRRWNEAKQSCLDNVEQSLYEKALGDGRDAVTAAAILLNGQRSKVYRPKQSDMIQAPRVVQFIISAPPSANANRQLSAPKPAPEDVVTIEAVDETANDS